MFGYRWQMRVGILLCNERNALSALYIVAEQLFLACINRWLEWVSSANGEKFSASSLLHSCIIIELTKSQGRFWPRLMLFVLPVGGKEARIINLRR